MGQARRGKTSRRFPQYACNGGPKMAVVLPVGGKCRAYTLRPREPSPRPRQAQSYRETWFGKASLLARVRPTLDASPHPLELEIRILYSLRARIPGAVHVENCRSESDAGPDEL